MKLLQVITTKQAIELRKQGGDWELFRRECIITKLPPVRDVGIKMDFSKMKIGDRLTDLQAFTLREQGGEYKYEVYYLEPARYYIVKLPPEPILKVGDEVEAKEIIDLLQRGFKIQEDDWAAKYYIKLTSNGSIVDEIDKLYKLAGYHFKHKWRIVALPEEEIPTAEELLDEMHAALYSIAAPSIGFCNKRRDVNAKYSKYKRAS